MTVRALLIAMFMSVGSLSSAAVHAHDSRPVFISVNEHNEDIVLIDWKIPASIESDNIPGILLAGCHARQDDIQSRRLLGSMLYACEKSLSGNTLAIDYPLYNPSLSALIRVRFYNGEQRTHILKPNESQWLIPLAENFTAVAIDYFIIGAKHILGGIDHLLFLAGLLYIARTWRRVLITVTGFTIAHSITIFLVALDVIRVSIPAVETVIALSIVVLAAEIARNNRNTLTWRRPLWVACGFGLVHGAGFAVALSETDPPQTEKLSALIFFNLGVEAGQFAIIALVILCAWSISQVNRLLLTAVDSRHFQSVFSYTLGIVSSLWFVERLTFAII